MKTAARRLPPVLLLALGVCVGAAGTHLLSPGTPMRAETVDRTEKTIMFTVSRGLGNPGEAVFVLDTLTGQMIGTQMNNRGFTARFGRNVAADFGDRQAQAEYAVATGLTAGGDGAIYVSENRSGQVIAYGIPGSARGEVALQPVGNFSFKQPIQ